MRAPCLCGCDHETHLHYTRSKQCGWCGWMTCHKYLSVRVATFQAFALGALSLLLPVGGGLWTFMFVASGLPLVGIGIAVLSLVLFVIYRDAMHRRMRELSVYRRRRKATIARQAKTSSKATVS